MAKRDEQLPLISDGIDGGHRHGFKSNQWLSRGKESLPASYAWLPNHRGPPIMMMLIIIMIMVIEMMRTSVRTGNNRVPLSFEWTIDHLADLLNIGGFLILHICSATTD